MDGDPARELAELLARPCSRCGQRALAVHEIEVVPPRVVLRCEACGHHEHTAEYKPTT